VIAPVDLGICQAFEYEGDGPVAVVLPGAMLGGMPINAFATSGLLRNGFRVIHVWDTFRDRSLDPVRWSVERLDAAAAFAGSCELVVAKSLTTFAAGAVADRGVPGVWLTPLLDDEECVLQLRRRTAPALLVGGTEDPTWDAQLATEISPEVLELPGADHGLARVDDARAVEERVAEFSARLGPRS
jgi:pimeloyl-ACP methyl ester carboxylesterase